MSSCRAMAPQGSEADRGYRTLTSAKLPKLVALHQPKTLTTSNLNENMMRDSDGIVIGYNTINASEHRAMPTGPALEEVRLRGRSERTANQAHGMHPRIVHSPAAAKATKRRPRMDASRDSRGRLGMEDLRNVLDRPDRWHDIAGCCSREPVPRRLWRRTRSWRRIARSDHDWIIGRAATKLEAEARHTLRSTRILTVRVRPSRDARCCQNEHQFRQ